MAKIAKEIKTLQRAIRRSLRAQGFHVHGREVSFRRRRDKRSVRKRHELAVAKRILFAEKPLAPLEKKLLSYIANGSEVNPQAIKPKLCPVVAGTIESELFRYACLHWSIPISEGYGRRQRYLIFDKSNNKLMGLFALGDPVYTIQARDQWIGWDDEQKKERLYYVMDAYVLGSVPPYSRLLAGKLVALATTCNEIRRAFRKKYANQKSLILGKQRDAHLALVTTTSALGRSSLYNRVKFNDRLVFESAGFTGGWGEFHFSDGVYERLSNFAAKHCAPTEKKKKWGDGFRNRRELVQKALAKVGFSKQMMKHGVQREVFVAELANNTKGFLCGKSKKLHFHQISFSEAVEFWKKRWLLPRAERDNSYLEFKNSEWILWSNKLNDRK